MNLNFIFMIIIEVLGTSLHKKKSQRWQLRSPHIAESSQPWQLLVCA